MNHKPYKINYASFLSMLCLGILIVTAPGMAGATAIGLGGSTALNNAQVIDFDDQTPAPPTVPSLSIGNTTFTGLPSGLNSNFGIDIIQPDLSGSDPNQIASQTGMLITFNTPVAAFGFTFGGLKNEYDPFSGTPIEGLFIFPAWDPVGWRVTAYEEALTYSQIEDHLFGTMTPLPDALESSNFALGNYTQGTDPNTGEDAYLGFIGLSNESYNGDTIRSIILDYNGSDPVAFGIDNFASKLAPAVPEPASLLLLGAGLLGLAGVRRRSR